MLSSSETIGRRNDIDPLVSYAFKVQINNKEVARFSNVDGLSYEVEMIEYRDSATPNMPMYRQGRKKPIRVTLKRGVLVGYSAENDLLNWITEVEKGTVSARSVNIEVGQYGTVNEAGSTPHNWELTGCVPTKWTLGALDGNSNGPLVETIELLAQTIARN
ncbi:MAG: phage tail protein [Proteobacteria bacterium]|nr:phage tail protein [Pseudomonadota bacterium]